MSRSVTGIDSGDAARVSYGRMRPAHLHAVHAALEDHITGVDCRREQIERHRDQRLRALPAYARELCTGALTFTPGGCATSTHRRRRWQTSCSCRS